MICEGEGRDKGVIGREEGAYYDLQNLAEEILL